MNEKNIKVFLIIGIIAMSFIILLTLTLGAYLIYSVVKKDGKLILSHEKYQNEPKITEGETEPVNTNGMEDINKVENEIIEEQKEDPIEIISDKNEILKSAGITNIIEKELLYNSDQAETVEFGSAIFIIYPPINNIGAEQEEGYFEAYQGTNLIYSSDKLNSISNIFSFDYDAGTYIIATAYSGGAHCCFTQYIFYQDNNGKLAPVQEIATNNATISSDSFFVKNNKLYLSIMDDRFAYFYTSYASSYSFNQFYRLNKNNLVLDNSLFKEDFNKEAVRCETDLKTINPSNIYSLEDWFPTLICKVANYWYAGDQNMAWNNFNDYFDKFKASEDPNLIRQEMEKVLSQPPVR